MTSTSPRRVQLAVLLALIAVALVLRAAWPLIPEPVEDPTASVDELRPTTPDIAEARRLLDSYGGDFRVLEKANTLLERELARTPNDPEALLQYARLLSNVMQDDGKQVLEVLDHLHSIAPGFADAYVLRVYVMTELGRPEDAWKAVRAASKLDSTSPWLDANRGALMNSEKHYQAGMESCGKVIERYRDNPQEHRKVMLFAYQCRRGGLRRSHRLDQLEAEYEAALEIAPDAAWLLDAYAQFLCKQRDRCADALPVVERALAAMDFGMARNTRTLIQYDLWAKHVAAGTGESPEAKRLLASARAAMPDLDAVMAHFGGKVGNAALVSALVAQGVSANTVGGGKNTALQSAACCGDAASVQALVAAGADVNAITPDGWSALMLAARENNLAVAQALIDAGADTRSKPSAAWRLTTEHEAHDVRKLLQATFPGQL